MIRRFTKMPVWLKISVGGALLGACFIMRLTRANEGDLVNAKRASGETGVHLLLGMESSEFEQGKAIMLKVTIANGSNKQISFPRAGKRFYDRPLLVTDDEGRRVGLTSFGNTLLASSMSIGSDVLAAGRQRTDEIQVNLTHDMSVPGKYTVVGTLEISVGSDGSRKELRTEPLDVTIKPAEKLVDTSAESADKPLNPVDNLHGDAGHATTRTGG